MEKPNKRIIILIGHYGTGKTTIAVNLAVHWAKNYKGSIALADLDVNNPYFRSRDWKMKLDEYKVNLIIPDEKIAFAEMPFLPREIYSVIQNDQLQLIIDMGGHDIGTTVLGSLSERINKVPYEMWMVINTFRPEMESKEEIFAIFNRLQILSNLKITGIINNTNLGSMTEIEDVIQGEKIVSEAAKDLGVNFYGTTVDRQLLSAAEAIIKTPVFPIERLDLLKW